MIDDYKYRAFISYSHADERWASWLHRSLESYRVPKRLVGTVTEFGPITERLAPVFRDRDELTAAVNLGEKLTRALEQSAFQIVICSPAAARSRWVNEEVLAYKRLGREHRVFCLIVDGEPGASARPETADRECFPRALIHKLGPDGELAEERSEPIAADARPGKDSKLDAKLKLIAGMLGVGLDELKQREAHRRHRRMALLSTASVAGMAITSVLATAAWLARNEARRQAETARQTTQFMVDLFKVSDPSEALGNTITAREILDKGATRIETELKQQPEIQATLKDTMGTVYTSLGLYPSAEPLVRDAVKLRSELAPQSLEAAESLNHLGEVLTYNGNYEEAERVLREALAIRRKELGDSDPAVADTLRKLADAISEQSEYEEAEPLIREALEILREQSGGTRDEVAARREAIAGTIEDLGLNFYERGEYEPAMVQLREAVEMRRKLHGELHPRLAQAMDNLAWALTGLGRWDEAESLSRDALKMKEKLYGDMHPETAAAYNNLAYIFELRGQLRAAETQYEKSLEINRKALGSSHKTIALTLSNLAFVKYAEGKRDSAIELLRESLEMNRKDKNVGPDSPEVAATAASLAYWLIDAKQYDEAGALLDDSLRIRRKVLGERHPQVAGTLTVKANLMLAMGRYEQARDLAREAQGILTQAAVPDDHWQVAAARNVEGAALAKLGRYPEAEKLLLASRPGLSQAPIPDLVKTGERRLADLYTAWGKPERAAEIHVAP